MVAQLASIPRNLDQTVDTLEGGALTVGTTEFEIEDNDGNPTIWTGVGYTSNQLSLNGAHSATTTTFNYFGDASAYNPGDYFYIGTETILIGGKGANTFTGCTRAQFRSTAQAFAAGYPLSLRPYTMANRRCWYNEVARDASTGSTMSTLDPDRCVRFAGTARAYRLKDGTYSTYLLTCESLDRELDRNCFRYFRSFKLSGSIISDDAGDNGNTQVYGWPGYTQGYDFLYNFNGTLFTTSGESFLLRIDNEIFAAKLYSVAGVSNPIIQLVARGLFGTQPVAHKEGALVQEIFPVVRKSTAANATWDKATSKFSSVATTNSPLDADHPLLLILQMLLSTGAGTNTAGGATRNYDVLPVDYGMAVDYTRVDITGIEAAAMEEPTLRFSGLVEAPLNFCDFMRQVLKIAGYYYIITVGDKFTIRRLRPPKPDVSSRAITNSNRIRKFVTSWDANWTGAVRQLVFSIGWDIIAQKYKRVIIVNVNDGDIYSKGLARTLEFESKFLYPGGSGIPGELDAEAFDVDAWIVGRGDFYSTRYGRPPPIIRERVDYSYIDTEIGDMVAVTHSNLPDVALGAKGLTASLGEVVSKSIDEVSKTIEFSILLTGWMLGSYRFIAPCVDLATDINGLRFGITTNKFTEPLGPQGGAQNDDSIEKSNAALVAAFFPGIRVWVWTPDYKHRQLAQIMSDSTGEVTMLPSPTLLKADWDVEFTTILGGDNVPQIGCHITHADYDTCHTDALSVGSEDPIVTYAFGANANDKLGAALDTAHKYFPT